MNHIFASNLPTLKYICSFLVTCWICNVPPCIADELVILAPQGQQERLEPLSISIGSQLVDFDISVKTVAVNNETTLTDASMDIARAYTNAPSVMGVLWLATDSFYLYIAEEEDSHFFSRPLPEQSGSWELHCDAIASVVRAMISSWRDSASEPSASQSETIPRDTAPSTRHPEDTKTTSSSPRRPVRFTAGVAYAPYIMSSKTPWVNGISLTIGIRIGSLLQISFEPGMAIANHSPFRLHRFPLRLNIGAILEKSSLSFGASLLLVTDVSYISSTAKEPLAQSKVQYIGFGGSVLVAYNMHPKISWFCQIGVILYSASNTYWHNNKIVFSFEPVQESIMGGIIFKI